MRRFEPDEPTIHGVGIGPTGGFEANAYGSPEVAEAVFTTESANTVSVLTVGGYAHGEWPDDWGPPETVEFYDTAGSLVVKLEYPTDLGG